MKIIKKIFFNSGILLIIGAVIILIFTLAVPLKLPVQFQTLWTPDGIEICSGGGKQSDAKIVDAGNGESIIIWRDNRNNKYGIYAQKLDSNGTPLWVEEKEITSSVSKRENPKAISDVNGGIIIVWQDYRNGNSDIYAQRLDKNGFKQWNLTTASDGINVCGAFNDQTNPVLIPDGAGGAIIAWDDKRYGTGNSNIYAQRIDIKGDKKWPGVDGTIICNTSGDQSGVDLTGDSAGGTFIVWNDKRSDTGDICAQKTNSNGVRQWGDAGRIICNKPGAQKNPRIISDGVNGAIITWGDERNGLGNSDIYALRIDTNGKPVQGWIDQGKPVCSMAGCQEKPVLIQDGLNGAIIAYKNVWVEDNHHYCDLLAQRIDKDGMVKWTNGGILCATQNDQFNCSVVPDGSNGAFVIWEDTNTGESSLYAQRIDADGNKIWTKDEQICAAAGIQRNPKAIYDSSNGFIVVWDDNRTGIDKIYVQRIGPIVNTAPQLQPIPPLLVDEGKPLTFRLTALDNEGDILTYEVSGLPSGSVFDPQTGIFNWTPTYTQAGTYSVIFTVTDNGNPAMSDSKQSVITVNNVNSTPSANAQSVNITANTSAQITLTSNDVEGDHLTYVMVTQPTHGTLLGIAPNVTYVPTANYNGIDSFTFKVNDGTADSNTATISINVLAVNVPLQLQPISGNLVQDWDMEQSEVNNWSKYGVLAPQVNEKTQAEKHSGNWSLHIVSDGISGVQYRVSAKPNQRYKLSFYYKLTNIGDSAKVRIGWGTSNADFEDREATLSTIGQWILYEREFTTPNTPGEIRIVIIPNGEAYFDALVIVEIVAVERAISNLLTDGDMEKIGVDAWLNYGAPEIKEKSQAKKHYGLQSLHVKANRVGVQQRGLAVEAGKKYKLILWCKQISGTTIVIIGAGNSNADFEGKQATLPAIIGEWTKYERIFSPPTTADLRLVIVVTGEAYLDDIVLEGLPNLIVDGNMEKIGVDAWLNYGAPEIKEKSQAEKYNGLQSLHVKADRVGVQQRGLAVEAGKKYKLILWCKQISGTTIVRIGTGNSNADFEDRQATLPAIIGEWTKYERIFSPPTTADLRLVIVVTGEAYLDEINLAPCYYFVFSPDGIVPTQIEIDGEIVEVDETKVFPTIQAGADALAPGDTLIVCPGVYYEQVVINRSGESNLPITIRALKEGQTELHGDVRVTDWRLVPGTDNIYVANLDKETGPVFEKDTGIEYAQAVDLESLKNVPSSFYYAGDNLYVHTTDEESPDKHVIDANVFEYGFLVGSPPPDTSHTPRQTGIVINGFVIKGYRKSGICFHNGDYCKVQRCTVHHNLRGIYFYNSFKSEITECEAFANNDQFNQEMSNIMMDGYTICGLMQKNTVYDTRQYGIRFYGNAYGCIMHRNLAYNCYLGVHIKGILGYEGAQKYVTNYIDPQIQLENIQNQFTENCAHECSYYGLNIPSTDYDNPMSVGRSNTGVIVYNPGDTDLSLTKNYVDDTSEVKDAKFVDLADHDFHLQSDSKYKDGGKGAFPYQGDVFFVSSNTGSDNNNDGTSVGKAWKIISHAVSQLRAGQTLYIIPGIYNENLEINGLQGSKENPTIIRAHGKGDVFLNGIVVNNCAGIIIEGIKVRPNGILVQNSNSVELRNNEVYDSIGDGIVISDNSNDVSIVGNISCFNHGAGIKIKPDADGCKVINNIVRGNNIQLSFPNGIPSSFWCDYNNIGEIAVRIAEGDLSLSIWKTNYHKDTHSISEDPLFVNEGQRDFKLPSRSPNRGRGYLDKTIGIPKDADIQFKNVIVNEITSTTADISWQSTVQPTTILVEYGLDQNNLNNQLVQDTAFFYGWKHYVTLTGLQPGKTYYFRVGNRTIHDEGPEPYHAYNYTSIGTRPYELRRYPHLEKKDVFDKDIHNFGTTPIYSVSNRIYSVNQNGDDRNSGSYNNPFRTIRKACEVARPGDKVVVSEGTYYESIIPQRSGIENNPIVFEAAPNKKVVISGNKLRLGTGADLTNRQYITIRGFYFAEQSQNQRFGLPVQVSAPNSGQVTLVNASNILIEQCIFDGRMYYTNSVILYYCKDITLRNNIFISHSIDIFGEDNQGITKIDHNTFLGLTTWKIFMNCNEHVIIKNNLFAENLYPKKNFLEYVLVTAQSIDMDYNCYYFYDSTYNVTDERDQIVETPPRKIVQFRPLSDWENAICAKDGEGNIIIKVVALEGYSDVISFEDWKKMGKDKNSLVMVQDINNQNQMWAHPEIIGNIGKDNNGVGVTNSLRWRPRGWPLLDYPYKDFTSEDLRLSQKSPCIGRGENSSNIGAE